MDPFFGDLGGRSKQDQGMSNFLMSCLHCISVASGVFKAACSTRQTVTCKEVEEENQNCQCHAEVDCIERCPRE